MLRKNNRLYYTAVTDGTHVLLKAPNSEVTLEVMKGVKAAIIHHIYTNYEDIKSVLPGHECLISPVVHFSVHDCGQNFANFPFKFKARFPHCLQKESDFALVKVRYGNIFEQYSLKEIPNGDPMPSTIPCFHIDGQFITLYTNDFCDVVCSSEEKLCHKSLVILPFGYISPHKQTYVKVKVFVCSYLYSMPDYYLVSSILSCFLKLLKMDTRF